MSYGHVLATKFEQSTESIWVLSKTGGGSLIQWKTGPGMDFGVECLCKKLFVSDRVAIGFTLFTGYSEQFDMSCKYLWGSVGNLGQLRSLDLYQSQLLQDKVHNFAAN